MTLLRAGVLGLGMMGSQHARVIRALEGVELVGCADPLGDRFRVAGGVPVYASLSDLLRERLDLCVVAVPTEDHEKAGLQLAEAGVHTLIEKPLANDVRAAQRLVEAFDDANLVGCVGHIERYNAALQLLRARLEQGHLGEIFQVATRRQGPFPHRVKDVGVVKDLATHDLDLTAWVAQEPYAAVSARTANKMGRAHEDLVAVTGLLENGTVTSHLVNWLTPMKERLTMVTGERGCYIANTITADLFFYANGDVHTEWDAIARFRGVSEGDMVRYAFPKPEPLVVEHNAVLGLGSDLVSMSQGLAALSVAEACLVSAREGRTVSLP